MSPTNPLKPSLAFYDHLLSTQVLRVQRDLSVSLSGATELGSALHQILKTIAAVTAMDCGGIYLHDEPNQALILAAHRGLSAKFVSSISRYEAGSPNYELVMRGEALYLRADDIPIPLDEVSRQEGLQAFAALPIQHRGKIIACLNVASHSTTEITPLTCAILEAISLQIATAIDRLRTEAQLRASEERFQALVDQSAEGIIICDSNGLILEWNRTQEQITGIQRKDVLGKALAAVSLALVDEQLQDPTQTSQLFAEWMSATATHTSSWFDKTRELSILRQDGQKRELEVLAYTFTSNNQHMICIQSRDLSGRKEIERRLRESELLFRSLAETADAGIFIIRDGQLIYSNPTVVNMTGYTAAEILDERCLDALIPNKEQQLSYLWGEISRDDRLPANQARPESADHILTPAAAEIEIKTRAGEQRWVEISWGGYSLFGSKFIIGIAIDISEQKRYAIELAQRNKELTLLNTIAYHAGTLQKPDRVIQTVRDLLQGQMNVAAGKILLFNAARKDLRCAVRWGLPEESPAVPASLFRQKYFVREGELVLIETAQQPDFSLFNNQIRIPLLSSGEIQGYLDLYNNLEYARSTEEIYFLENLGRTIGMFLQNIKLFNQVTHARERFQAFARRLVQIQEAERRHISRELHDEAGQSLTYILMGLDLLRRELPDPEAALARVDTLKKVANDVMGELHRLATDLRPVGLDRLGLYAMLQQTVETFRNEFKIQVDFKFSGPVEKRLPLSMETALYRIVQEAFTNIARHAHCRSVSLLFGLEPAHVKLIIKDDGVGFDTGALPGEERLGLLGIQERVEMLGGIFVLESTPGKGTILLVEVPLDQKNLDR